MSKKETVSNTCLAEIDAGMARVNEAWMAWDEELAKERKRLEQGGMDMWEALDVIHQRQMEGLRSGTGPVTFSEMHVLLDELFDLYLRADEDQRLLIADNGQHTLSIRYPKTSGAIAGVDSRKTCHLSRFVCL